MTPRSDGKENKKSKTDTDRTTGGRKCDEGEGERMGECVQDERERERESTLVKKRRNIEDCENKKEKRYAGYVINSDKFHRTQHEEN